MVYRGGSAQNEIVQLASEITDEVKRDAAPIATGIFGTSNKGMPDMRQVSNQTLDELYRQKYQSGDREWLVGEAHRDPQQFLDVSQRIGVQMPPPQPDGTPAPAPQPNAFAQQAAQLTPQLTPPGLPNALPPVMPVAPPPAMPPSLAVPQLPVAPPVTVPGQMPLLPPQPPAV